MQLVHATIEDVSSKEDLGDTAVEAIVDRWISREVKWEEVKGVTILGLDEIARKKGHRDCVGMVRRFPGKVIPLYSAGHDDYASKRQTEMGDRR